MHDELSAAVETLEAALARAADLAEVGELRPVRRLIDDIRARRGFLGKTLVVAIAGGTGTGKSSVLNALAGATISPVGPIRPTTDRPIAWIPPEPTAELAALLDDLAIAERVQQASPSYLAIVDLPDFDSVVTDHRQVVEDLLARVDVVVWVVDPEKYNDRVLHRDFIEVFRRYQDQFLFVLNQVDLVNDPLDVANDWERRLFEDGVLQPAVIQTAADPAIGAPTGIEDLRIELDSQLDAKKAAMSKVAADLLHAVDVLADTSGVRPGTGLGFEPAWRAARDTAAAALASRGPAARHPFRKRRLSPPDGITTANVALNRLVGTLAAAAGPKLGLRLREEFPPDRIRETCRYVAARLPRSPSAAAQAWIRFTGWASGRAAHREYVKAEAMELLDVQLGTWLRQAIRPRGELAALLAELGVEAARIAAV